LCDVTIIPSEVVGNDVQPIKHPVQWLKIRDLSLNIGDKTIPENREMLTDNMHINGC